MEKVQNSDLKQLNKSYDYLFKLIIVGDSCVGKTSLLHRFHGQLFQPTAIPTIGIDFRIRTLIVKNKVIKLQIWDTSGQEKYDSITTSYYRGAMGVLVVYDVTNRKSFEHIQSRWLRHVSQYTREGTEVLLIGNKCDMDHKREVNKEKGETFAINHGLKFFETSAKENINVEKAFTEITHDILNKLNLSVNEEVGKSLPQHKENATRKNHRCCQITISI